MCDVKGIAKNKHDVQISITNMQYLMGMCIFQLRASIHILKSSLYAVTRHNMRKKSTW